MPPSTIQRRSTLAVSWTVLLLLTLPFATWMLNSPMVRYTHKFGDAIFFPPDGPNDRFQYFHNLLIERDARVDFATCVLCSIRVEGTVYRQVTTLWGDVTVASTGVVDSGIEVNGGSIWLLPGARVDAPPWNAFGGSVVRDPRVDARPVFIHEFPRFFYPGQRSWPVGAMIFVAVLLLAAVSGGHVMSKTVATTINDILQRPLTGAFWGLLVWCLPTVVFPVATISLFFFPPLAALLYFGMPVVLWIGLAVGIAAVSEEIGSGIGNSDSFRSRLIGAAVLAALMLVPVLGVFVMLASMVLGLGAAASCFYQLLWRRGALSANAQGISA